MPMGESDSTEGQSKKRKSLLDRIVLGVVILLAAIFGIPWIASQFGETEPNEAAAAQVIEKDVFGDNGITCFEIYDFFRNTASGPPCAVSLFTSVAKEPSSEWCVNLTFVAQRQSDINAIKARDLDRADEFDLVRAAPYFEHEVLGWGGRFCGTFRTLAVNGRNDPDNPDAWSFVGPIKELRAEVERAIQTT